MMDTMSVPPAASAVPATSPNGAAHPLTSVEAEALLAKLGQQVGASATVNAVFGQPQTIGERTIIPVARVAFGFGGGAGNGQSGRRRRAPVDPEAAAETGTRQAPGDATGQGAGFGGGAGLMATPVAVVEIGPRGVRVVPIVDVNRLVGRVFAAVFGFAFAALMVSALTGRRRGMSRLGFLPGPARLALLATRAPQHTITRLFTQRLYGR
jgi:uncharacterized spore protein YtfJ